MEFNRESFFEGEILLINKPLNWTSFQVVNKIRWLIKSRFNIKKIKGQLAYKLHCARRPEDLLKCCYIRNPRP